MNLTIFNSDVIASKNLDNYPTLKQFDKISIFLKFCPSEDEAEIISNLIDYNRDKIEIILNGKISDFEGFVFLRKMNNLNSLLLEVRGKEMDFSILRDFDNLKKLKVTIIGLEKEVPLSDFIEQLKNLETLVVSNKLSELAFINSLHSLKSLFIANNTIDFKKVVNLDSLVKMSLGMCEIRNYKPDIFFRAIKFIGLFGMYKLRDLSFVSMAPNLEFLELDSMNRNFYLPDFSENKNLKKILIDGKKTFDYSNITTSSSLEEIVLLNNKCLPYDFILTIGEMRNLKKVYIENICDIDISTISDILQKEYISDAYMRELGQSGI
ncbi:MAG: hypothetical protein NW218_11555 [Saprospiraceae bacterium]|nr:hypothetical protein [Saprospiraceae bacterium]